MKDILIQSVLSATAEYSQRYKLLLHMLGLNCCSYLGDGLSYAEETKSLATRESSNSTQCHG